MTNMIKYLRLFAIFFLLSSAVYAEDAIDRLTPTTFCKEDPWDRSCIERIEQAWLGELGGKAKRVKDQLILRLQSGRTIIRKNSPKDVQGFWESKGKPNVKYRLYAYLGKAGFYVLHLGYWEDHGYEFISEKDGSSVGVSDQPIFSPNRSRFFVAQSPPYWSNSKTTELQIYSIRPGVISKMWSDTRENWPPVAASWISNEEIHLYEEKWEHGQPIHLGKLGVLTLANIRWTLVEEAKGKSQKVK